MPRAVAGRPLLVPGERASPPQIALASCRLVPLRRALRPDRDGTPVPPAVLDRPIRVPRAGAGHGPGAARSVDDEPAGRAVLGRDRLAFEPADRRDALRHRGPPGG